MRQCIWLSGMAAVFLMGCDKADDRAMRTLYERDYTFKIGDYFRAAKDGDAKAVAAFLEFGMEPDVEDGYGQRSLLLAASEGREDVVRMLVAAGSEVDYVTPEGETPILAGAGSGSVHVLEVLLAAGANPAYRNPKGWGTLTKAAAAGDARSVEKLVAEVPAQRDEALLIAAMEGEVECIDVLLAHARPDRAFFNDLHRGRQRACAQQQRQVTRLVGAVQSGDLEALAEPLTYARHVDHLFHRGTDLLRLLAHHPGFGAPLNEHHTHELAHIVLGGIAESTRTAPVQGNEDRRSPTLLIDTG